MNTEKDLKSYFIASLKKMKHKTLKTSSKFRVCSYR